MSVSNMNIVGVGASAGGLTALQELVQAIPEQSGLSFIVIQHLAPDHPSIMDQLLSGYSKVPVTVAKDGERIEPDHVYVIPPGPFLVMEGNRLKLVQHARETGLRTPIDRFFNSMAEACGPNCCAVILSGTGSDGTEGLRAVKAAGGVAIVQKSASASFPGMPESAAATGLVDLQLKPGDIPAHILELDEHRREFSNDGFYHRLTETITEQLPEILKLMLEVGGHDFSGYKPPTLVRRVLRRMSLLRLHDDREYLDLLRADEGEVTHLAQDFLIGVTQFFRDKECFEALREKVLPELLEKKGGSSLRIWVPGCSTGEEVYSLAMMIIDEMEARKLDRHVQIFGTDIDLSALRRARSGHYPASVIEGIDEAMRDRFFVQDGGGWKIRPQLREMCVFAPHNLLQDPPFSRLDLISCRNVMIYLSPDAQDQLLPRFHYALNPGGFLMLGSSESLGRSDGYFNTLDRNCRLFHRNDNARPGFSSLGRDRRSAGPPPRIALMPMGAPRPLSEPPALSGEARAEQAFLNAFAAPFAVINAHNEVLYQSQQMAHFVRPGKGAPSAAIDAYLAHGLRLPLQNAVSDARSKDSDGRGEVRNVVVNIDDRTRIFDVRAKALDDERTLVVLQEVRALDAGTGALPERTDSDHERLEGELLVTRKRLTDVQREFENAEQDLKGSNEELLSMNEELQSANEELETSREELQSINEELETINAELSENNRQLTRVNSDLKNLLESTELATVFLDKQMCVRLFTPTATRIFNLQDRDIGRPIEDLRARIHYPELSEDAALVARRLEPVEREVKTKGTGEYFLARVRPYRSVDDRLDGCILTFQDITASRRAQKQLSENARVLDEQVAELETLYDTTPVGLALLDTDLRYLRINETMARINGLPVADHIGRLQAEVVPKAHAKISDVQYKVLETGQATLGIEVETETPATRGEEKIYLVDFFPVRSGGKIFALGSCVRDVTQQRQMARQLAESEARMRRLFDQAPSSIAILEGPELRYIYVNKMHDETMRRTDLVGKTVTEVYHDLDEQGILQLLRQAYDEADTVYRDELPMELTDAEGHRFERYARIIMTPWFYGDGTTAGIMAFMFDITDAVQARKEANAARRRLQTLQDSLASFVGLLDPDGRLREVNQTALGAANLTREDVIGKSFWDCYWWDVNDEVKDRLRQAIATARTGEMVRYDTDIRLSEDRFITIDFQLVPVTDDNGEVTELVPSGIDVSQRKQAETDLRAALAEFEAFFNNAPVGMSITDPEGRWTKVNRALAEINGFPVAEHIGRHPSELMPGTDVRESAWKNVVETGEPSINHEVTTETPARPGEKRTFSLNDFPIRLGDEIRSVGHSVLDISEQKAFEARQRLLIAELQHRVKNTLATVQSITRFTARNSSNKAEMAESLQQRLAAIARTHDALTREDWQGQGLMTLLKAEIDAYDPDGARVTIEGDDVRLDPGEALSFGLGFHELVTNAAKYGAFSTPEGTIKIRVAVAKDGTLAELEWLEDCRQPIRRPDHEGFGTFLLKNTLGAQVNAEVSIDYTETGLHLRIAAQGD